MGMLSVVKVTSLNVPSIPGLREPGLLRVLQGVQTAAVGVVTVMEKEDEGGGVSDVSDYAKHRSSRHREFALSRRRTSLANSCSPTLFAVRPSARATFTLAFWRDFIPLVNFTAPRWGQYGDVYEALWRRHNSIVAVKTLKQDVNLNLNDFLAEASIMKNLQHKNLVRLLGWSWEAADRPSFAEVRAELEEMWRTIDMGEAVSFSHPGMLRGAFNYHFATDQYPIYRLPVDAVSSTFARVFPLAVAEELAKQSALSGNTDHLRQHPHFATDADAHAMAAITSPHQPVQLLSGRKRSRRRHDAGASSPSTSTSSATSVETDGEDGDDESEEAHPLGSEHGVHNSASNWNATRACGNCYQGDYVGGGSGSGGGGVGAPASDLPLPTAGSSSRDSQLSAPACLPSPQQRPAPHAYHGLHQHPHRLHHHRQQQQQHVDFGRVAPRRRGPSHAPKRPDESSLRCPVRQKEKTITPAESGVGESIVSADSPGCDIAPRQRDEETALATSGLRRNHGPTTETGDLPGNSCCPTPTGDLTDGDLAKPMSFSATADDGQVKRGGRLNAEAVTQFTTLPAQDRITRYLESLGELGGTDGERGQQVNRSQQIQLIPDGFPKFPPPPPIPPPAQSHRNLRQSAERHRNQVGRSVSCYQTVPNVQLPVTNCLQQETTPPISLPLSPDTIDRSDVDDPCITPTDDVYQNDVVCEEDEEEEESGLEGSKEHQLTARLNNLSLQANELSSACPQLTTELSALSNQLSACREQIEGRLRRGKTGEGSAAEDQCLMGISQALRQIQQALSNMKARVDSLQPSPFIAAVSS
ncbi:unnamed protein product [Mesocestoides corti]|uniref:Tyrosine-protein kinase catalytic domain-containing protein n=1 Tax=Mesocestoides corti TaxID=53468 RepID=A0A158QSD2_MESCO|nr:unnamed protein product [Mesocestoides corti]